MTEHVRPTQVLLAEDDPVTRRLLEAALQRDGHDVVAVEDGARAVESFTVRPASLVVLDWEMPQVDGLAVCRTLRTSGRLVFILMLTSRDGIDDVRQAFDAGVDDYLVKPVTPERLRLRLAIAQRRLDSDAARAAAERALDEARWREGISDTIVTLQHEINNPLAALHMQLELAADDQSSDEERRTLVRQALVQTRRITEIMRRVSRLRESKRVDYVAGVTMLKLGERDGGDAGR